MAVLQVIRKADDPEVTLVELSKLIELDAALSVNVLRISNSALYSPVSEIKTIERALTTLGLRSVRLLALSTSLRMLIPDTSDSFDTSEIRRRMVVSGSLARKVCSVTARPQQDEAFLAGLLTGLGRVVLADKAPEHCRQLTEASGAWPSAEEEREQLGYTTDDITARLVREWGLPESLCQAIENRAQDPDDEETSPLDRSLQIALLAEHVLCGATPEQYLPPLYDAADRWLSMTPSETDEWLIEAEPLISEAANMLEFEFPQVQAYSELLIEATQRMQALTMEAHATIVNGSRQVEELSQRNVELQQVASTDALTGLPNRGALDQTLAHRVETLDPSRETTLGLLLIDLDHFKSVNDMHGHGVGDDVLREIGSVLQAQTRDSDFPARYGGEEFVVLIGDATRENLGAIAERFRARIADVQVPLPTGGSLGVTASIGGALFGEPEDEDTAAALTNRADERLYKAKNAGRNRTVVA